MDFLSDPVTFIAEWLRTVMTGWGFSGSLSQVILYIISAVLLSLLPIVFSLVLIWAERKLLGRIADRIGPNRVGPGGIFQPIADMLKIFTKEIITPAKVDKVPYNLAPILSVAGVLLIWAVIPFAVSVVGVDLNVGVLYLIAAGGFGTLGFLFAGWGSNNKYSVISAFRAVAQLVSYEIPMTITLLIPVMFSGSLGITDIVENQTVWNVLISPLGALIFYITTIAENGRSPFDLLEADSELVAGFNTEYSGLKFGMFYVADFLHAFTLSMVFVTIFLGGWRGPGAEQVPILGFIYLMIKTTIIWFVGIWIRGSMPRIRIDQMLNFSWKVLTPAALALVSLTALVDKLLPAHQTVVRVGAMLILNGLLFLAINYLVGRFTSKSARPVVAPEPYPVQNTGIKDVTR
ncbi:MAG: NADH-quinone oxidoreductase subunit NuoH [Chloroflexi bacterium]|nr:NADH-quinone oxidoreductase subunit NuoH [Chloroflexota bacterium]